MPNEELDIGGMQCLLFNIAQKKWNVNAAKCADIFERNHVLEFIRDCHNAITISAIPDDEKEVHAVLIMRTMLNDYCADMGKNFEQELLSFARSKTYEALFDLKNKIWEEGSEHLRNIYEDEMLARI